MKMVTHSHPSKPSKPQRFNIFKIALPLASLMLVTFTAASSAKAGTITFDPLITLKGTGFGTRLTILSLQNTPTEMGATTFADPLGTGESTNQDSALTIAHLQPLAITAIPNSPFFYTFHPTATR